MASVAIVLNTTYKLANSEYAVAIRVTHERKQKYHALTKLVVDQTLPFKCSVEHWKPAEDNGLGKFRKTFLPYKECNAVLKTKLAERFLIPTFVMLPL
jgi:integrase/recombinase XerD